MKARVQEEVTSDQTTLAKWRAQMDAVERRDWDGAVACFAPDCEWRLITTGIALRGLDEIKAFLQRGFEASEREPPEVRSEFATKEFGVFEYTSRGIANERADDFVTRISEGASAVTDVVSVGRRFEIHVCFVYHLDTDGLIDRVNEYIAMPALMVAS